MQWNAVVTNGPNFLGSGRTETRIVAGVTSYGLNGNCAGTGACSAWIART